MSREDVLVITMVLEISSPCPWTCWISTANPENLTPNFPTTTKLGSTTHKSDIRFFKFYYFFILKCFFANMPSCLHFCALVCLSQCLAVCYCTCLPVYFSACAQVYLSTCCQPASLPTCLPFAVSAYVPVCLSLNVWLNTYLGLHVCLNTFSPCHSLSV